MAKIPLHKAKLFAGRIEPVTIYRLGAIGILRAVSNLTRERVKKDPKFRRTMANAAVLGRASRIGSFVYRELPKEFRQFWMYKAFTGEAIQLLRQGKTDKETQDILWKTYAEVWVNKETCSLPVINPNAPNTGRKNKKTPLVVTSSGELSDETTWLLHQYKVQEIVLSASALHSSHKMIRRRRSDCSTSLQSNR